MANGRPTAAPPLRRGSPGRRRRRAHGSRETARDRERQALRERAVVKQAVDEAGVERVSGTGRIDDLDLGSRQSQGFVPADRQTAGGPELQRHRQRAGGRVTAHRLGSADELVRRFERILAAGDERGLTLVGEEDVGRGHEVVDIAPSPVRIPVRIEGGRDAGPPGGREEVGQAGSKPRLDRGRARVQMADMREHASRHVLGGEPVDRPQRGERARDPPRPSTTVAPVGMAGSTPIMDTSTP